MKKMKMDCGLGGGEIGLLRLNQTCLSFFYKKKWL